MGVQSGFVRKASRYCAFALSLLLASCGGGGGYGGGGGGMMGSYTIGGTVSNLASMQSVQLYLVPYEFLTVMANGSFTFSHLVSNGSYQVTVYMQPTGQTCTVANNGMVMVNGGSVMNVAVTCTP